MGIPAQASVYWVITRHRRQRRRGTNLNEIEDLISVLQRDQKTEEDMLLWKNKGNQFKTTFSSKATWNLIRREQPKVDWYKGVWFRHATPKYAFMTWLSVHDRLSTGDRMLQWTNVPPASHACVFCQLPVETRDHLFFSCGYSSQVWKALVYTLLGTRYTTVWADIMTLVKTENWTDPTSLFLLRYCFQITLHSIWKERNSRKHGDRSRQPTQLIRFIDKGVRNRV
ncbi:uncharacterized protein LOC112086470 [Eutrema salsugineum]|uniref:uncharacterized protein LOC112086470 n=1 Tax=Eutrema salsugineum TaxID=72664 RepID=UPI000CED5559|nr:uncharacterized protein LOC112086470 [Eutrema salsugineum]